MCSSDLYFSADAVSRAIRYGADAGLDVLVMNLCFLFFGTKPKRFSAIEKDRSAASRPAADLSAEDRPAADRPAPERPLVALPGRAVVVLGGRRGLPWMTSMG